MHAFSLLKRHLWGFEDEAYVNHGTTGKSIIRQNGTVSVDLHMYMLGTAAVIPRKFGQYYFYSANLSQALVLGSLTLD